MEVDTNKFNPQSFPMTNNKIDSINKRLGSVELFLKENYILRGIGINPVIVQEFFDSYNVFCAGISKKALHKIDFNKQLATFNIIPYVSNKHNKYKISRDDLLAIAKKKSWIHALDVFTTDTEYEEEVDYKTLYENAQKEIEQLKALKPEVVKIAKKPKPVIIESDEELELELERLSNK
jgi:hypothetical protein